MVFSRAPMANRIEILQSESDRIHHVVTARTRGIGPMRGETLANWQRGRNGVVVERGHIGRRWRWRFTNEVRQNPVTPQYGRRTRRVGSHGKNAPLPEQPAPLAL